MGKFIIEIERPDGWRRLTSLPNHADGIANRDSASFEAERNARRQLGSWSAYFGSGQKLRLIEVESEYAYLAR